MTATESYSHDKSYKRLFSNPELVKELIEGFVSPEIACVLDFDSLEKVEGSFITPAMKEREGDLIWKLKAEQTTVYVYLLLEFQSTVNHAMPVRMMQYISALYDSLIQQKHSDVKDGLPPVLPIVLYNGDAHWTAKTSIQDMMPTYPKAQGNRI